MPQTDQDSFEAKANPKDGKSKQAGKAAQPEPEREYLGHKAEDLIPQSNTIAAKHVINRLAERNKELEKLLAAAIPNSTNSVRHRIENLHINSLHVDQGSYQREENDFHILKIAQNFDPQACTPPLVCHRKYGDKKDVLVDGQQRALAAAFAGYANIECAVVDVRSVTEEARLFSRINEARRAIPTAVKHKNRIHLREEQSLTLQAAVLNAGITVGQRGGNRVVRGVTRLHSIATTYANQDGEPNYELITESLEAYIGVWPDHRLIDVYLLGGFAMLIWAFKLCPDTETYHNPALVTPSELHRRLIRAFPTETEAKGHEKLPEQYRKQSDAYFAMRLLKVFNRTGGRGGLGLDVRAVNEAIRILDGG